ncbi:unnamed protein product [Bursaphelenchus xylophilus]|nr:unnamed protein product [Bursaphelenchus xylophilus]CAG9101375.1 unnamed protein product [Bursaphelenchus xylophilus]
MSKFVLTSKDGDKFEVDGDVLRPSKMLHTMITDLGLSGGGEEIPLENVQSHILKKVLEWCEQHKEDFSTDSEEASTSEPSKKQRKTDPSEWDTAFLEVDAATLFDIIAAANYLDIEPLLELGCKQVANTLRGKTAEQIRAMWGINETFGPKEEKQCRIEMGFTDEEDEGVE